MKNMKKFLSLALTGAMMLGMLAGCGGDGETQVATADDSGTTTQTADSGSATLSFVAPAYENITYAGSYTGSVTFTVSVKDAE